MNILFLKGISRNDVLRVFVDRLSYECSLLPDVSTTVVEMEHFSHYKFDELFTLFSKYDAIVSFNAIHADESVTLDHKKHYLFDMLPTKHICWLVDDVVYHLERLRSPNANRMTLLTSELQIKTAQQLGFDGLLLQSLSGGSIKHHVKPHQERQYDVAVAASWMGQAEKFWMDYDPHLRHIIDETIACVEHAVVCNAYPIFAKKLSERQLTLTSTALQYILSEIHSYIRKKDRLFIIKEIVSSGVSVAIIGTGWKDIFSGYANVDYMEDLTYEDITNVYENARVVVNLNAENGACERVFDGIESGAMIFSDFSNALYQIFSYDNGVLFYQKHKSTESIERLLEILAKQDTERLAHKAQQIVLNGHTWAHRAKNIYDMISWDRESN